MRSAILLSLLLLASCAGDPRRMLSTQAPGLDVAEVALTHGMPDTALRIAEKKLASDRHDVAAMVMAADAQAALGRRDDAARGFDQALAIEPGNAEAALGLGRMKLATDPATAARLFLRVSKGDRHKIAALIDLGIAKDLLGQHGEAQTAYRRALAIEPDQLAANVNLGLSLALSGDPGQALTILRPLAAGPGATPRIRQDLAVALAVAGDNAAAASVLKRDVAAPQVARMVASYQLLR